MGGRVAAGEDAPRDRVPVDRKGEGPPDPRIIEGRAPGVEAKEEGLQERIDPELRRPAPVGLNLCQGN